MITINKNILENKKNLLAFSHGVDSSALFHVLLENNINFDMVIVNYNYREESKVEFKSSIELADKFGITIHTLSIEQEIPDDESSARSLRHDFFRKLIVKHGYDNLLTGHHLNDRLEWFLMQMTKGAGIEELMGMNESDFYERDGASYNIIRPFIYTSRDEIYSYLLENDLTFFEDKTNQDEKFTRNKFRSKYVNSLVNDYSDGLTRSFRYMEEDIKRIEKPVVIENCTPDLVGSPNDNGKLLNIIIPVDNDSSNVKAVDRIFKKQFQKVMTSKQRKELVRLDFNTVLFGNVGISKWRVEGKELIIIYPYVKSNGMESSFKSECKKLEVPILARGFFNGSLSEGNYIKNITNNLFN